MPEGRPVGAEAADEPADGVTVTIDADGLPERVLSVPVEEARYRGLRAVKGGLVWLRAPLAGVLGEGGADLDEDRPRSALQRFDLRKLVPGERRRHQARRARPRRDAGNAVRTQARRLRRCRQCR